MLSKYCIQLVFGSHEDVECIAHSVWGIDSTPIDFKFMSPLSDVRRECLDVFPIWARLPSLPSNM